MLEQQFQDLRTALNESLVERTEEVEILLLGILSGEHVLFVGPPGTAKSQLCNSLADGITGSSVFKILLSKFTDLSELMGPLHVNKLKDGHYVRIPAGCLPEAHFAFIDEIWKSGPAVLNNLLTAIEERKWKNDGVWYPCPLRMLIAASNEWPIGEGYQELGAMFDRFLLRKGVREVSPAGRRRLFFDDLPKVGPLISLAEMDAACAAAQALPIPDATKGAYENIVDTLHREGIRPGDRRCRKAVKVARAAAWLDGAPEVSPCHLEPLKHVLWEDPRDQVQKCDEIVSKIANPMGHEINTLLREAAQALEKLDVSDMAAATAGVKKAQEVRGKLERIVKQGAGKRADEALAWVKSQLREVQLKITGL